MVIMLLPRIQPSSSYKSVVRYGKSRLPLKRRLFEWGTRLSFFL